MTRMTFVGHRFKTIGVAFLLVGAAWLLTATHAAANGDDDDEHPTFTVDDDHVQCPAAQYTTIQGAVDAAALAPGAQSIRVCPGTYSENVLIGPGNSVEIRGSGTGNTFVTGVSGTAGPIFDVLSAGTVSISRLTVDGMSALAGGVVWGIRFNDTSGEIRELQVLHVRDVGGAAQGIGIEAVAWLSSPVVKITHNLVRDFTRVGIDARTKNVVVRVTDNTVIGPDEPKVWAPNGIEVSRGAAGRVEHNRVSGPTSPNPPAGAGSGILLYCAGIVNVRDNRVSAADLGIAVADTAGATVSRNRVENSIFDAYSLQFLGTLFGDLGCPGFPALSPTRDNVLRDNRAWNSGEAGISLFNYDPSNSHPDSPSDNLLSKNDIRGSGIDGIVICSESGPSVSGTCDFAGGNPARNVISKNRIRASGDVDARDETTGGGTAGTANTWRANRCKTSDPDGLCRKDGDEHDDDWHTFGTAEGAKDPTGSGNDVIQIDTTDSENFGAVTRDLSSQVGDLTGHLSVDYYIKAIQLDPILPGGPPIVIDRGCGGGPPRFELAIDLNGDGLFDGNAIGFIGPAPTFTSCPQDQWTHQDLTDDALRWSLLEFGGLPLTTWADVVAFFDAYPNHWVQGGTLTDDSALIPVLGGLDYYDNVEVGNQILTHEP